MNPYGNNGFNRINQQRQQQPQQQQYVDPRFRQMNPGFGQPQMQQGYNQPGYGQPAYNQMQQPMDPRFQRPMQQPMYQQPVDPRFNQMQQMQQGFGQPAFNQMQQPMYQQPMRQGYVPSMGQQQTTFGQLPNQQFNQPTQVPNGAKTFSSMVDDVKPNVQTVNQTQQYNQVEQSNVTQEPIPENVGPATGHEFPPYYDPNTEVLEKIIDNASRSYVWKLEKRR